MTSASIIASFEGAADSAAPVVLCHSSRRANAVEPAGSSSKEEPALDVVDGALK